jgi:hypothetical protein
MRPSSLYDQRYVAVAALLGDGFERVPERATPP